MMIGHGGMRWAKKYVNMTYLQLFFQNWGLKLGSGVE